MESHPNNEGNNNNNNDGSRWNNFPTTVFLCPCCPALFFSSTERNIHYFQEILTIYNQEVATNETLEEFKPKTCHHCQCGSTVPVNRYFACAMQSRRVTQMPDDDFEQFYSDHLFKVINPPGPTEIYAYFEHDFDMLPVVLNNLEVSLWALPPPPPPPPPPSPSMWLLGPTPRVTLDLVSVMDQPVAPIPDRGTEPRSDLMEVDGLAAGQEGEAPPPEPVLALGSRVSEDEIEETTLILGPPGSEKESIKKKQLDLNLKI